MANRRENKIITANALKINNIIGRSYAGLLKDIPGLVRKYSKDPKGFEKIQDYMNNHLAQALEFSQLKQYDKFYNQSYRDQMLFNRQKLGLSYSFTQSDTRALQQLGGVSNWYVSKYQKLTDQAVTLRQMRLGWEQGLGDDELTESVLKIVGNSGKRLKANTKTTIITNNTKVRTNADLNNFDQNGIETYEFKAVIDGVTTDVCRELNGKRYSIGKALDYQNKVNADMNNIISDGQAKGSPDWKIYNKGVEYLQKNDAFATETEKGWESNIMLRTANPEKQGRTITKKYRTAEAVPGNALPRPPLLYNCRSRLRPIFN